MIGMKWAFDGQGALPRYAKVKNPHRIYTRLNSDLQGRRSGTSWTQYTRKVVKPVTLAKPLGLCHEGALHWMHTRASVPQFSHLGNTLYSFDPGPGEGVISAWKDSSRQGTLCDVVTTDKGYWGVDYGKWWWWTPREFNSRVFIYYKIRGVVYRRRITKNHTIEGSYSNNYRQLRNVTFGDEEYVRDNDSENYSV